MKYKHIDKFNSFISDMINALKEVDDEIERLKLELKLIKEKHKTPLESLMYSDCEIKTSDLEMDDVKDILNETYDDEPVIEELDIDWNNLNEKVELEKQSVKKVLACKNCGKVYKKELKQNICIKCNKKNTILLTDIELLDDLFKEEI